MLSALLAATAAATALIVWSRDASSESHTDHRPDIVLISIDSLRADHLGSYGYDKPTSPTMDRLAAEGVRFANAISSTSWTLPSHSAIFTGLYDSAHGVYDLGMRLSPAHLTLAEVLSGAGYQTAGFFGGPLLHPTFGLSQGFGVYQSCMAALPDSASDEEVRHQSRRNDSIAHGEITGPRTVESLSTWLEGAGDAPIFVFLHLWDVHYDYIPPKEYVALFDPDYSGDTDARQFMLNEAIHVGMDPRDLQHVIALYDGEIRLTDDTIGQILDLLERRGRLQNTLIVITSDHGEEFFEHGGKGHHRTLYDEVLKVPLIFHWPGHLPSGLVIKQQVRLIDLMPTILSLAGIELEHKVQGRDLSAMFRGQKLPLQSALSELLTYGRRYRSLRTNGVKLFGDEKRGVWIRFNLMNDPGEHRQLSILVPRAQQLMEEFRQLMEECVALYQQVVGD